MIESSAPWPSTTGTPRHALFASHHQARARHRSPFARPQSQPERILGRWVQSVKDECLSKLILFGEPSLRRALQNYLVHYDEERNHQGKEKVLLFLPLNQPPRKTQELVRCRDRLGGLLRSFYCASP